MRNAECEVKTSTFRTSLGWAGVAVSDRGIAMIVLPKKNRSEVEHELASSKFRVQSSKDGTETLLSKAVLQLERYFSGEQVMFDLPLDLRYYTPFQQSVWQAAAGIPFGQTRSYQWIAKRIKKPLASRAVGGALGANPVPVIIPCHRVITSAGTLGGFSGGLGMKEKLLELEKSVVEHG